MLARFIYAMPKSHLGERQIRSKPVPARVAETYAAKLKKCLETPAGPDGMPNELEFITRC